MQPKALFSSLGSRILGRAPLSAFMHSMLWLGVFLIGVQCSTLAQTTKVIWLSQLPPYGNQSGSDANNPIPVVDAAQFDAQVQQANGTPHLTVRLKPGEYYTSGINWTSNGVNLQLIGSGRTGLSATTLRLVSNAQPSNPDVVVLKNSDGFFNYLGVSNLNIDCNWGGQGSRTSTGSATWFRLTGIDARAVQAHLYNVGVINSGANGRYYGGNPSNFCPPTSGPESVGTEAFLIRLSTVNQSDANWIKVYNCEVSNFTSVHGAYCTAIMVNTRWAMEQSPFTPGSTRPSGTGYATTWAAEVSGCSVNNIGPGIAFGCATSDKVRIANNTTTNVATAFNSDTGKNERITIENNSFHTHRGINFGAPGTTAQFVGYDVLNNTFFLRGDLYVPVCSSVSAAYAVRLNGGTSNTSISGNVVYPTLDFGGAGYYKLRHESNGNDLSDIQSTWPTNNTWYTAL